MVEKVKDGEEEEEVKSGVETKEIRIGVVEEVDKVGAGEEVDKDGEEEEVAGEEEDKDGVEMVGGEEGEIVVVQVGKDGAGNQVEVTKMNKVKIRSFKEEK